MTTATSVIIETRGGGGIVWGEPRSFVLEAVRSISATSRHREVEFVIVHHSMTPGATLASLGELPDLDLTFVPVEDSVTPAAALNVGALHASGRVLVFCEEHTQARSDEMLGHLIAPLSEKAAMVGPKLVDPDGDVWHAGAAVLDGVVEHPWRGLPDTVETSQDLFRHRAVDALDPSIVAIDREPFLTVGGWSEEMPERFRGLDLGLKLRREGHALRWSSEAVAWRFPAEDESRHRSARWEEDFLTRRWGKDLSPARPR